jgi:hypothetical protein
MCMVQTVEYYEAIGVRKYLEKNRAEKLVIEHQSEH